MKKSKEKFNSLLATQTGILNVNRPEKSFSLFFVRVSLCYEESFPFTEKIKQLKILQTREWDVELRRGG